MRETARAQQDWQNRIVRTGTLRAGDFLANEANWRIHPAPQRSALAGSLSVVGWVQQVIVNLRTSPEWGPSQNVETLVDGHLRVSEALGKGEDTPVPTLYVDLAPNEEKLVLASLDPIGAMAAADKEQLGALLRDLDVAEPGLMAMLAELAEREGLDYGKAEPVADPGPQVDRAAELQARWGTCRGQIWELPSKSVPGKCHRLMCGDSTDAGDVARLMGGERAGLIFTDPPYNVASEGCNYAADAPTQKKTYEALKNAEWDKDFDITAVFPSLEAAMAEDCACYVCTSHWLVQKVWEWMWSWSKFCSYCIWCKPNPAPSLAKRHWTWATEMIAYAVRGKHVARFPTEGHALNWWPINSPSHTTDHPTEKPVAIPLKAIEFSSNPGDLIVDLFLGSGTTMVAAEQTGRVCYGMEIEPKYTAVALERMAGMGLTPRLSS